MTFKTQLRDGVYDAVGWAFSRKLCAHAARTYFTDRRAIVFYHAVWQRNDPRLRLFGGVELQDFASAMQRLENVFRFVSLDETLQDKMPREAERPTLAITFDDGFDLISGGVLDVLAEHGIVATVFVNSDAYTYERLLWQHAFALINELQGPNRFVTAFNEIQSKHALGPPINTFSDFIDASQRWPTRDVLRLADEIWSVAGMPDQRALLAEYRPYLDRDGLAQWRREGHAIGFHGKSHLWSSSFDRRDVEEQLLTAGAACRNDLGLTELPFAYPFGDRLSGNLEQHLIATGVFSSALGTDRLTYRGESPFATDRIEADFGLPRQLFGCSLVRTLRGQDRRAEA
jgi:peptidoglycan/xylan/chitin deacetylase (PgdA/CDA1 family)